MSSVLAHGHLHYQDQLYYDAKLKCKCHSWWGVGSVSYSHDYRTAFPISHRKQRGMPQHHSIGHAIIWQMRAGAVPPNYSHSPTALPKRSALKCWPKKGQDPISSAAAGNKEDQLPGLQWVLRSRRGVRASLPHPHHHMTDKGGGVGAFSLMLLWLAHPYSHQQSQF